MKRFLFSLLVFLICAIAVVAAESKSPHLTAVEPDSAKVGDIATAKGENLDTAIVTDLFLTDGKNDVKVVMTERSADAIKFKIPRIKAGRYRLMTASKAALIEQPVVLEVSEP